jgi:Squalene-hopene cyclase C-terminal domain/Prenyltransferase and squalene oxidase repeat
MTWPLVSAAVLLIALAAGFAWYERGHPSARVLALVGTLAALAVLGRIAFAPLPNVKPTTDIVVISGYVLGGAPGFVVGAVTALVSNFFFGQGPWTPWQMAAWGGVGVGGAVLARATGRRLGRLPLALACAVAGLAYGFVLDLSTWVNFFEARSTGSLGAVLVSAAPFDAAHAIGNFVFCLAFGPALVRAVSRFRERFQVDWRPLARAGTPLLAIALVAATAAAAAPTARAASSTQYLLAAQNDDGGFGPAPGTGSTQLHTGWTALGLAAAGRNPADVSRGGKSIVDYLRAGSGSLNDTGELERTILVLHAAGIDPTSFADRNLVAELNADRKPNGSVDGLVDHTAFGIFAFRAAGQGRGSAAVKAAASWLARQQNADGGFGFARHGTASDVDNTASSLQALVDAGRGRSRHARRALAFLRANQNRDGGFPLNPNGGSNAQSTAWAIQALVAARQNPSTLRRGGRSPVAYLKSLTGPDGAVRYSRTSKQTPVWVTGQALTALEGKPFPLAPVPRAERRTAPSRAAGGRGGARRQASGSRHQAGRRVTKTAPMGPPVPTELLLTLPFEQPAYAAGVALGLLF